MTELDLLITSGVGPPEARRFAALLAIRLEALAEERGLEVSDVVATGDPEAPRSITLRLRGPMTKLLDQLGTHALIQRSDKRGRASRKRWFAAATAHPAPSAPVETSSAAIPREALEIIACRAGGPGGQHVNKVSTAVRVRHIPSGITIRSAGSRSQRANLDQALRRLAAVLHDRAEAARAGAAAARRDAHYRLERGRPIHVYKLDASGQLVEQGNP
jgi:protein subunit release factor B